MAGPCAGIAEVYSWLRGYEEYYIDLARNKDWVAYMLDRLVEFKSAFWERALREIGDLVDIVVEADDLGGQQSLLMSPRTYRQVIQPRHKRLFSFIKEQAPVKLFYHTCGAVRRLIPDLIDAGIDILNPVQISAAGMDLREMKQEFGPRPGLLGRWCRYAVGAEHGHSSGNQRSRASRTLRRWRPAAALSLPPSTTSRLTFTRRIS